MAKEERSKRKRRQAEKKGETFYNAYPAAQTVRQVNVTSYVFERLLWWALGIVEVILLIRIVMAAFGAVGGNIITAFFYAISYPFVILFFYLFNSMGEIIVTSPRFELETLAAMAFYYIVIYIITQLVGAFREGE